MADAKTTTKPAKADAYVVPQQKVKTLDSKDYDLGWTAQAPSRPEPGADLNPVTFSKDQLPYPEVMKEQGVPIESYLAHFGNVEGATVNEGVLVDDDSGEPLSEALPADVVEVDAGTSPVAVSKAAKKA